MNKGLINKFAGLRRMVAPAVFTVLLASVAFAAYSEYANTAATQQEISQQALPAEAKTTLQLIKQGGPFPYARDGVVFGNHEKLLPRKSRGYYHEYTVKTPGVRSRGARRIVCGPPAECYYTDDHYESFKRIRE